ncbi:MAG: efflux RND transporter periplasmic adaptor subunit [Deltaproteobacteria bacterium]|nr:efflux RND transporter periplasmic adaptor subunit [Deltaproteobacteria bacterium]
MKRGWWLAVALGACGGGGQGQEATHPRPVSVAGTRPAQARFEAVRSEAEAVLGVLSAEVVLPPEAVMSLSPPLAGRIMQWQVAVGDEVAVGMALATITTSDLADLEAALAEAERVAAARDRALAVEREAMRQGLSAATEVQALEVAAAEVRARRDALSAQLAAKRSLGADTAERPETAGGWAWKSPVAGVVQRLELPVGATASPEAPALSVVAVERARVRAHVPERWLARLPAQVRGRFVPTGGGASLAVTLALRAPTLDPTSRTQVHDFVAAARLEPGRSGRLELVGPAPEGALAVPAEALTRVEGVEVVFPDQGEPVPVERVGRTADRVLVRAREPGGARGRREDRGGRGVPPEEPARARSR